MTIKRPENRIEAIRAIESAKDFIPYPTVVLAPAAAACPGLDLHGHGGLAGFFQ